MPTSKACPGALLSPFVAFVFLSLVPNGAQGQVVVKVNDNVNFRLGTLLQTTVDWTQQHEPCRDPVAVLLLLTARGDSP